MVGGAVLAGCGELDELEQATNELGGEDINNVVPIPATIRLSGVDVHVQAPPFTGVDSDPSTVFNFQGISGIAFVSTTATRRNKVTGVVEQLDSFGNHMVYMKGVYRGFDGIPRVGTFGFV